MENFYMIVMFETTICFNSNYMAWFFDPFYGMPESLHSMLDGQPVGYGSKMHSLNNVITVVVLFAGNSILAYYVFSTSASFTNNTKLKKQFVIQICVICFLVTCCSFVYVYMQFFNTPIWLIVLGSLSFNLSSGTPAFTYLFLNPTLRKSALNLFWRQRRAKKNILSILPQTNKYSFREG